MSNHTALIRVFGAYVFALLLVSAEAQDRPRGIYSLGTLNTLSGLRTNDFVDGFTVRVRWDQLETSQGVYNFSLISNAIAQLQPAGKKLTVEVFVTNPPAYVVSGASETWNVVIGGTSTPNPVPWDTFALNAWHNFMQALANFTVADSSQGGALVLLKQHPTFAQVDAPIVGIQSIRDQSNTLRTLASYSRGTFIDAIVNSIHSCRDAFPVKFVFLGYFSMTDTQNSSYGGQTFDQSLTARLYTEFNAGSTPQLGFFQELLADSTPTTTGIGKVLYDEHARTYTMFQALTSWTAPFTNPSAVASGNPATGIAFAYNTYDTTYFELYVSDIDNTALQNDLRTWHTTLVASSNTAPTITSIANQTIMAGSNTSALSFTVGDAETVAASLTASGSSSNTTLLPNANIVFGGSDASRTVTLTPAVSQTGTATVTITVSDGALTSSTSFTLTVNSAGGFTFTPNLANNTFTYSDAQRTFTGIFVKPAGNGPFPAVIINHGQGGSPSSYSLPKANEMSPWGLVCIGPELTHVGGGETAPETTGNCPENVARGEACLNALVSLSYVDPNRIAIFGHSKGAYATIGQVAALTSRLKAAGMTAGGIVPDSAGTNSAAPTTTEATPVRTPFIMFHGTVDPSVSPSFSLSFQNLLTSLNVSNDRILYDTSSYTPDEQHNLQKIPSINADFLTKLHAWFITQGVLPLSFGSSQGSTSLGTFANSALDITLSASGGTGPYTWTIVSGSLPAGVTLSSSGVLSGTATASGTSTFTVKATDSTGGSTTQAFTLGVSAPPTPPVTSRNGDGSIRLDWATEVGVNYVVEFSDDFATWSSASSPFTATTTSATWTDDGATTGAHPSARAHRYYRLRASR